MKILVPLTLALGLLASPGLSQTGACSHAGVCSITKGSPECSDYSGTWLGAGTTCDTSCALKASPVNQAVAISFVAPCPFVASSAKWSLSTVGLKGPTTVTSGSTATAMTDAFVAPGPPPTMTAPGGALLTGAIAAPAGAYQFGATGIDAYGRTITTIPVGVRLPGLIPPPTMLTAAVGTDVKLSWLSPDPNRYGAGSTTIRASTSSAGPFTTVLGTGVTGNMLSVPRTSLAGTYLWYLIASTVSAGGEGPTTGPLAVNMNATIPLAPTNLAAFTAAGNQIKLTWTAPAYAISYDVFYSKTSGSGWMTGGTSTTPLFVTTVLSPATRYYFVVIARGAGGQGPMSGQVTALTTAIAP